MANWGVVVKIVIGFSYNKLSICIVSLMLVACGGGGGGDSSSGSASTSSYPEPTQDIVDDTSIGFYDYDANDAVREIRNDLVGNFSAQVQFGQSHVVDPNANESKKMPRLTSEKEALLIVMPTLDMQNIKQLKVEIYQNNRLIRTATLDDPTQMPVSDQSGQRGRPDVWYSKRAWTTKLNWDEVKPGLRLKFIDANKVSGELAEDKIDFAAPGELVLNNIRVGMLADKPNSTGHYMLLEPEKAGTDYFQTIPAAEMTVAQYDDIQLTRAMVSSGVIYDSKSAGDGGVYAGDMREDVGKSTFSVGINLANWGITSASMANQSQPQLTQTVVVHHTKGNYANGVHTHGLSGGNGMLTLYDSVGNEFSHEIGHHYGLGHYPGQVGDNLFWAAHHADSGWGYIANRNMMRGNLSWTATWKWDGANGIPNFKNLFPYGKDAMSGGYPDSNVSRYTHYTGYSTFLKIQPHFDRYVWDETSPTGYKKWNKTTREMEVAQPKMPNSTAPVWYNADQNYPRPRVFGQPVITILGGYDPVNQVGLLYPAARSNWGNVYDLTAANTTLDQAACWLNVQYTNKVNNIALAPARLGSNANKLHVNLALADQPQKVNLYCKKAGEEAKLLANIDIPVYSTAIKPAVKIGRQHGYSALRAIELPQLESALEAQAANAVVALNPTEKMLYESYKNDKSLMNSVARQQLTRYESQQNTAYRLNRWMNVYAQDLTNQVPEAQSALEAFMTKLSVSQEGLFDQATLIKNGNNCLKAETLTDGKLNLYISGPSGCTADESEQWVYDAIGRIHSKSNPDQCVTGNGGSAKVTLERCVLNQTNQIWTMDPATTTIRQSGQCMDLNTGRLQNNRADLIRYSCTNGGNQRWTNLTASQNLLWTYLSATNMKLINK